MRVRFLYICLISLVLATTANAQNADTAIKSNTIEIIQSYKPEVKQHPKPVLSPNLPPVDTSHPVYRYVVPQQMLYYTYSSLPLRPLALGKDSVVLPYPNYVKLGGGNLSTIYLDAGVGSLRGKNYETAIHLHSISQKGNIQYQQTSLNDLLAEGTLHKNGKAWHASIAGLYNQYYYYGYNHNVYQYSKDSLKQAFTGVEIGVDMQNESVGSHNISYHPSVSASVYSDKFKASETTFNLCAPFTYIVDNSLQLKAAISGTFTQLKADSSHQNNNVIQIAPGIVYNKGSFSAHAYLDPTIGQNGTYFLPDILASYRLPKNMLTISMGWQSLLQQNTYKQLTAENPYIYNNYTVKQTRSTEVFGNVSGNVGHHLLLSGRISWWQFKDLPVFINNMYDQKQLYVSFDDQLNAISFKIAAHYQVNQNLSAGFSSTWYSFSNSTLDKPWGVPGMRIKGDLLIKPLPALTITAYLSALDNIYALDSSGQSKRVKGVFDLGATAEYDLVRRISVFVQVDNLLNSKNERWMGYTSYGINVFGGIRVKF